MRYRAICVLATALTSLTVGVGCGTNEPVGAAEPRTESQASSTWSLEQAAEQYLRAVEPLNDWISANRFLISENASVQEGQRFFRELIPQADSFVRELARGRWPASVQAEIDSMISRYNDARTLYAAVASASTASEFVRVGEAAGGVNLNWLNGPGGSIRTRLGLPPPRTP